MLMMAFVNDDTPELRLLKQEVLSVEQRLSGVVRLSFIVFVILSLLSLMVILTPVLVHVNSMGWNGVRCENWSNHTIACLLM